MQAGLLQGARTTQLRYQHRKQFGVCQGENTGYAQCFRTTPICSGRFSYHPLRADCAADGWRLQFDPRSAQLRSTRRAYHPCNPPACGSASSLGWVNIWESGFFKGWAVLLFGCRENECNTSDKRSFTSSRLHCAGFRGFPQSVKTTPTALRPFSSPASMRTT